MSPEEAHRAGLIDWNMFVKLRSQECDWEEISVKGPGGESSVIQGQTGSPARSSPSKRPSKAAADARAV